MEKLQRVTNGGLIYLQTEPCLIVCRKVYIFVNLQGITYQQGEWVLGMFWVTYYVNFC
jgi:hypothetical protein